MAAQTPLTNADPNIPVKKTTHPVVKFFRKVLLFFTLVLATAFVLYYVYITHPIKDDASIEGTLIQFTIGDGMAFKTNEGMLNRGTTLSISSWAFSVQNDSLAQVINNMVGKKIKLRYKENVGSFFWQGKTNRFVFNVEESK
jgi:hypothetical protein